MLIIFAGQELERARQMVEELEGELKVERTRLRALTTEQSQAERQKEEVVLQLCRTESVRPYTVHFTHVAYPCVGHGRHPSGTPAYQAGEP